MLPKTVKMWHSGAYTPTMVALPRGTGEAIIAAIESSGRIANATLGPRKGSVSIATCGGFEEMRCYFFDDRHEFVRLLASKLGHPFDLVREEDLDTSAPVRADADLFIVSVPSRPASKHEQRCTLIRRLAPNDAGVPVIAALGVADRQLMRDVLAAGAFDFFPETDSMENVRAVLRRAVQMHELRREIARLREVDLANRSLNFTVANDPSMIAVYDLAAKVATTDANVLITGETGTGKEVLARAIHAASPRASYPFIAVSCSALPETLIEAELFGHEKGAFTGAVAMRRGRMEVAGCGTLFLDEVGEFSPALQTKLLRVLQEHTFERLGSNQIIELQARLICATHRDLKTLTRTGAFRSDLYYRLKTVELLVPPLRERGEDVLTLARMFVQQFASQHRRSARTLSAAAVDALMSYPWPGNVRELQHAIEHAVIFCDGEEIQIEQLPSDVLNWTEIRDLSDIASLDAEVRTFKRQLIEKSLQQTGNNKVQAARVLKISRSSLHRLIDELGIDDPLKKLAS